MTQEILDYLLIRAHFILLSEEEILKKMDTEEMLAVYCNVIYDILVSEPFLYTNKEFIDKLDAIILNKRFEGKHSNDLIVTFNMMVGEVQKYKKLTEEEKLYIQDDFIKKEATDRCLPFGKVFGVSINTIYEHIKSDSYYARILLQDFDYEIYDFFPLMSTINLLINRYSELFIPTDEDDIEKTQDKLKSILKCYACIELMESSLKEDKLPSIGKHYIKKYIKLTKNNIKKVLSILDTLDVNIEEASVKELKKTKN